MIGDGQRKLLIFCVNFDSCFDNMACSNWYSYGLLWKIPDQLHFQNLSYWNFDLKINKLFDYFFFSNAVFRMSFTLPIPSKSQLHTASMPTGVRGLTAFRSTPHCFYTYCTWVVQRWTAYVPTCSYYHCYIVNSCSTYDCC